MDGIIQWSPGITLEGIERQVILAAFRFYRGNKTATATSLGISIRTLDARLEVYQGVQTKEEERLSDERAKRTADLERHRGPKTPNNVYTGDDEEGFVAGRGKPFAAVAATAVANANAEKQEAHSSSDGATAGVGVESAAHAAAQPDVSLSQRQEVQKVLPRNAPQGGKGRTR